MKFLKPMLFICAALFSLSAVARTPVPIINYDNVGVVTGSGKTPQVEQVKQAIQSAAASKNWTLGSPSDGMFIATLVVRNKHTVVVQIPYDATKYSIDYKDSINMKYGVSSVYQPIPSSSSDSTSQNGQPEIHPFYNNWVKDLKEAIRLELLKL